MLFNFPSYLKSKIPENEYSRLEELRARQFYIIKWRPPFSADVLRCALHHGDIILKYNTLVLYLHGYISFSADLVTFTEEIRNGKLHFLCSVSDFNIQVLDGYII